jgi:predicted transcriptional regulator
MVKINKLKGKMVEKGMNVESLSKALNIDKSTLYRKLSENGETFLIKEANLIAEVLSLTYEEASDIFFSK